MLLEGGKVYGIVHKHRGIRGIVVTEGLIEYDGDVKDSSLVAGLSGHSAPGGSWRGRSDRVLSFQWANLQEFLTTEGTGVLGFGPLPDAAETEGVLAAIDWGLS